MRAELLFQRSAFRHALAPLLAPLTLLYAAALAVDRAVKSRRRRKLPVPVISVGNLTVGGTGKTPVLLHLLADLARHGVRPAVLTRGYAGAGVARREGTVFSGDDATGFSDEVRLVAERMPQVPIGVGANRGAAADALLVKTPVDVFVLDDGFQQWALERDLDVVCVDASRPFERFLLPLGLLREPACGLRRAQVVLLTRCELASANHLASLERRVTTLAPQAAVFRTRFRLMLRDEEGRPAALPATPVLAVSAIGHPGAYEDGLRQLGLAVTPMRFPDHHAFTDQDVGAVAMAAKGAPVVVTTKDWVKLRSAGWGAASARPRVLVADQTLVFDGGEPQWLRRLQDAVRQ